MSLEDHSFDIDSPVGPPSNLRKPPRFSGDELGELFNMDTLDDTRSIDAFFKDLEDTSLPAPLDHEAIEANLAARKKQVESLDPFAISNTDEPPRQKINRRPIVKLDRERLIDPKIGIPNLINISQSFKPTGKGNERDDLKRLLKMYRLWTHSMYPKGTFRDNIESVEALCHRRAMKVSLRAWRDEFSESGSKKKAKLESETSISNKAEDSRSSECVHPLGATSEPIGPSNFEQTELLNDQSPSNLQGPLFRPGEDSENEFPMEDNLCDIFETIDQVAVPLSVGPGSIVKEQIASNHYDDEYAEEEALLREAEAQNDHTHSAIPPLAPRSMDPLGNDTNKATHDGKIDCQDTSNQIMLEQQSNNPSKKSTSEVLPLFRDAPPDVPRDEAHDWDDLYQ